MSIGELSSLYRDGELVIQPAYQRLYRWEAEQKSRLVESILLGIPLPSIFVSQAQNGKWELIDGLQRVSTILQLQGLLPSYEPLRMEGTKYLKGLEGMVWESDDDDSLSDAQRLDFKRSKVDVKIVKRESDPATKYDLFQRLNSYGTPLAPQEMRHALLAGVSAEFGLWLQETTSNPDFQESISLPEKLLSEKYDEDLVLRFLYLHENGAIKPVDLRGFNQKLDDASVSMAEVYPLGRDRLQGIFTQTFEQLNSQLGSNAFRKWSAEKDRFAGGFLNTAFEVLAMGLAYHIATGSRHRKDLQNVAVELWAREEMSARFATGVSTEKRLSITLPLGRELLAWRP
ncbi:DUF262 domain-containing protein [Rathayibacter sp. VKM Ac-2856]|uniref:DUF262 domain-containing protein n=1 Tax=unclassified Rathayibacter TaxID=2609250 RepID=UPI001566E0A8|nr:MULTISPECIES: DUF262 domain-containing protein [unclassified Rathayibacter]NQX03791.1 DUF262 domain-containing protein [Rathayibacter sp. VKM Ac-2858]NQX18959.1 DUF262 domain-containing protein [Rathayibacter sp. VKM Ac-2856]